MEVKKTGKKNGMSTGRRKGTTKKEKIKGFKQVVYTPVVIIAILQKIIDYTRATMECENIYMTKSLLILKSGAGINYDTYNYVFNCYKNETHGYSKDINVTNKFIEFEETLKSIFVSKVLNGLWENKGSFSQFLYQSAFAEMLPETRLQLSIKERELKLQESKFEFDKLKYSEGFKEAESKEIHIHVNTPEEAKIISEIG